MKQLVKVSISDFKLIFRDFSLRVFLLLPGLIFLVINVLLPLLIEKFPVVRGFVAPVLIVAVVEATQMFGFIYGMVLIEEKETEVARVYGVLPVSKAGFILGRLVIPFLITAFIIWLLLYTQPFYQLSTTHNLLFSLVASLIVPVYVIGIAILCKNKMEGMVWIKVFNTAVVLPIIAFFIPSRFELFFGILPSHWIFQALNDLIYQQSFVLNLLVSGAFLLILLVLGTRKFTKVHFS